MNAKTGGTSFFPVNMSKPAHRVETTALVFWVTLVLLIARSACFGQSNDWQTFERRVREGDIDYQAGLGEIARWAVELENVYPPGQSEIRIFFPLEGYSLGDVGGKEGNGYRPEGYEFVGGNRHKGHPAQDIFIHDKDQNGLDDRTGNPVAVLAVADGVVLSTLAEWMPDEAHRHIRGGNYIWVYHPALKIFSYYAHLQDIRVQPGDRVAGGQAIATLGRTGTNAYPAKSPTHLHLMLLKANDMTPVNPYPMLKTHP